MESTDGEAPATGLHNNSSEQGETTRSSFVKDTLTGWGLQEYLANFEREKIDERTFFQIPDDAVAQLIPPMGPCYKFILERQKLQESSTSSEARPSRTLPENGQTLRALLQRSRQGIYLLAKKRLRDKNALCTIVVDHLIDKSFKVTRNEFIFWADEIVSLFPSEKTCSWYVPSHRGRPATGKLYNRFTNQSKRIKPAVTKYEKRRSAGTSATQAQQDDAYLQELQMVSLDDIDKIKDLWTKTFKARDKSESISDYYARYPQLRTPLGAILIELDYEQLDNVPKDEPLKEKWSEVAKRIVYVARRQSSCAPALENTDDVPPEILAFRVLPYLFRPTNMKTGLPKTHWRPSQKEQSDGFITWINSIADFETALAAQRTILSKYKLTLQPLVVAVGPLDQLAAAYVVIDDVKYAFANLLDAVNLCFKAFYALNASFPVASEPIWIFLQKAIFGIEEKKKFYQSVESLRSKLADVENQRDSDSDSSTDAL